MRPIVVVIVLVGLTVFGRPVSLAAHTASTGLATVTVSGGDAPLRVF